MQETTSTTAGMLAIASQLRAHLSIARPMAECSDSELDLILTDPRHPLFDAALDEMLRRDEEDGEEIARHYNRLGGRG